MPGIEAFAVPVAGGMLSVARLRYARAASPAVLAAPPAVAAAPPAVAAAPPAVLAAPPAVVPPAVVAVHGITANNRSWLAVAAALAGRAELVAVDLRGRGDSRTLPPPYGFAAHEADLLAVLDALGPRPAVLVGHSLGAYIVAQLAADHPDRVRAVVLVDGGLPLPGSEGMDPQQATAAGLGPALARFSLTFPNIEAYTAWWEQHPAFAGGQADADLLSAYATHDLAGTEPELRPTVSEAAVRADITDVLAAGSAAAALATPATLLVAPRGLLNDPNPLQPFELAQTWAAADPQRRSSRLVHGVNHYTIVMGRTGAAAVAEAIADL